MSNKEAARFFARFKRLEPPFGAAEARRALGSQGWLSHISIGQITDLAGSTSLHMEAGGSCFWVELTPPKPRFYSYNMELRTTKNISTTEALIRFFHGDAPDGALVLEYTLGYPFQWDRPSEWTNDKFQNHNSKIRGE